MVTSQFSALDPCKYHSLVAVTTNQSWNWKFLLCSVSLRLSGTSPCNSHETDDISSFNNHMVWKNLALWAGSNLWDH